MKLWRRVYEDRRRVILPLIVILAINVGVFAVVVLPLERSVLTAESSAADARVRLAEAQRFDRQTREARASKDRADQELHTFYTEVLPHDLPTATKITNPWLQQAAVDAGLRFQGAHSDYTDIRESRLTRAFSKVTLQGRYPNIRKFLYAMETAKEFVVVERVELAQAGDQPATNGLLEISLVVATYFLAQPQS